MNDALMVIYQMSVVGSVNPARSLVLKEADWAGVAVCLFVVTQLGEMKRDV